MFKVLLVFTATFMLLLSSASQAQWSQTDGPPGGIVQAFFTSGSKFFMGTTVINISTNDGASWREIIGGPTAVQVFAGDGATLFAGRTVTPLSSESGLFRSTDDGETWIASGLAGITVYDLVVTPNGIGGTNLFAGTDMRVFRSTDNGMTWTPASSGLPSGTFVRAMASKIDSVSGPILFAGTSTNGVFLSTNNGDTWTQSNNGIISSNIHGLFVHPDGSLFAGTSASIYRSTNNGANWFRSNGNLSDFAPVYEFAIKSDGAGGTIMFATGGAGSMFRSIDNGATWAFITAGPLNARIFYVGINQMGPNGGTIYAGSLVGFFRSTDNGLTWIRGNLYNSIVNDLVVKPEGAQNSRLFAGGRDDVYHSSNLGEVWTHTLLGGHINAMAVNTSSPGSPSVFAASAGGGLFRTMDNGTTWTHISNVFNDQSVLSLLVTPDGSGGTFIIAGTFDGLWISTDNGNSWIEANNGLDPLVLSLGAIPNVTGGPTLLAGTFSGVYRSTNNGASWIAANSGLTNLEIRSITPSGTNAFVGTQGGGIFASSNNGVTWSEVNNGLTNTTVWRVFALPGLPGNILAGTNLGIFHSSNGGQTWSSISSGLPPSPSQSSAIVRVYAINILTDGSGQQYLVAGTEGRGVWKRPLLEIIPVELTSFTASVIGNAVELNWSTASEINNQGFEIEKQVLSSEYVAGRWERIGFVEGNGTTPETNYYSFTDIDVSSGKYFYRLKQLDYDGSYEYSEILEVKVGNTPEQFSLEQNYPNPFNPSTIIKYHLPSENKVSLKLYNALGKEIATLVNETKKAGVHQIEFTSGDELSSGVYFYTIKAGIFTDTKKLILIK